MIFKEINLFEVIIILHILAFVILAIIFVIVLMFLTYEIPIIINNLLIDLFPDFNPSIHPEYVNYLINTFRPFGYSLLITIILLIILGFLIKKEKISVSSSFLLFLPSFGQFAFTMFFLAGIGILEIIWLPLYTPFFNFLKLGDILFIPVILIFPVPFFLPNLLMVIGLFIFTMGVLSWIYGKYKKEDIIKSLMYKYNRHPQYLGFIIWSYGLHLQYRISGSIYGVFRQITIGGSLPWVIFTLVILANAFLEDIKLSKKYPEKYMKYCKETPYLFGSRKVKFIIKKNFPENGKDILKILVFYLVIIIGLTLLMWLIFPISLYF